jgi:hypothetical protein
MAIGNVNGRITNDPRQLKQSARWPAAPDFPVVRRAADFSARCWQNRGFKICGFSWPE